ncbi:DedA family protein [Desulfomicrobium sp. ZS1]|uniref:YqaA family protein n=1 Tax=Desulfomicrobium sp. ZS1 TaxID=2952228 RepID=UPI0020B371A2|nr:YqaA family protein [Desulfomicrobium sp. ZS1]UTF48709.1 DedA family protein [Desulfomicrobium sp. ZS1]
MEELLLEYGLYGLFVLSFLAATFLPVASEAALGGLILAGGDPYACVAAATIGNTLGAVTTWGVGRWGSEPFLTRLLGLSVSQRERAVRIFARYGSWSLLLAWTPILGDPLCAVAGLFGLSLKRFIPPVVLGKLARYAGLAYLLS